MEGEYIENVSSEFLNADFSKPGIKISSNDFADKNMLINVPKK